MIHPLIASVTTAMFRRGMLGLLYRRVLRDFLGVVVRPCGVTCCCVLSVAANLLVKLRLMVMNKRRRAQSLITSTSTKNENPF